MNNAFIEKQDYFGITTTNSNLVCLSADDGCSSEFATATGQDGSFVAGYGYGEKLAPSNEYAMKATTIAAEEGDIKLG